MEVPKTVTGRKALKVAELKEVLAGLGLATDGTKAVLLERLEQHLAAGDAAGTAEGADQGAEEAAEPPVEAAQEQPAEQSAEVVEAAGEDIQVSETPATTGESVGVLSLDEQRKKRAERFGIPVVEAKSAPAGKPGTMDDKLKERAARFGLPVSGTAAGEEDKKAARNKRFGGVDASVEAEKKKARSERFGTAAEVEAQQAKLDARAKRFANPGMTDAQVAEFEAKKAARAARFAETAVPPTEGA